MHGVGWEGFQEASASPVKLRLFFHAKRAWPCSSTEWTSGEKWKREATERRKVKEKMLMLLLQLRVAGIA